MTSGTRIVGGTEAINLKRHGTMSADVVSIAPDGSLVVRVSEWIDGEAAPRASRSCNVYGDTQVVCPSPGPSDAQWVLMSYLGRRFFDGAPWDANNHWQRRSSEPPPCSIFTS